MYCICVLGARAHSGLPSILDTYGRTDASPAPPHRFLLAVAERARCTWRRLYAEQPTAAGRRASRAAVYYNSLATKFQNAHSWTAHYTDFSYVMYRYTIYAYTHTLHTHTHNACTQYTSILKHTRVLYKYNIIRCR